MESNQLQHAYQKSANPFRVEPTRQEALRLLKRVIVHFGLVGGRVCFKAAEAAFEHIPELRSA